MAQTPPYPSGHPQKQYRIRNADGFVALTLTAFDAQTIRDKAAELGSRDGGNYVIERLEGDAWVPL
jgi:hypothetical protein